MIPPHPGDLVDERLRRMGVLEYVDEGKIGSDVAGDERGKRERDKSELRDRGRRCDRHQYGVAPACADNRYARLNERQTERQYQGIMTDLGYHCAFPCRLAPLFF